MRTGFILFFAALAVFALAGCTQDSVTDFRAAQAELAENPDALDGKFSADIIFCRRVGKKSGKIFGPTDEFTMDEKSSVAAAVRFENVPVGKVHALHLVWVRPGLREAWRSYYEVTVNEKPEGGYVTLIEQKTTDDKGYLRVETRESDTPSFQLDGYITTSWSRNRDPGTYSLRVYLHRELLLEEYFTLELGDRPADYEMEAETEVEAEGGGT